MYIAGIYDNDKSYSNNIYILEDDKKSDANELDKLLEELELFGFIEMAVQ